MKLIIASNRLPITVTENQNGFEYKKTSGGLVTGIESLSKHLDFIWLGNISGIELNEKNKKTITSDCWNKFKSVPVFIDPELNHLSYNGFCNAILWPIFHELADDIRDSNDPFAAYVQTNAHFAQKILEICEDGDIVWVHDYHLMLVPEMLRKQNKTLKIMFFLHTAFPHCSILKQLIQREKILQSLSSSDVISFHLPDYALNFKNSIIAADIATKAKIKAIPIGIDPEMFRRTLKESATIKRIAELKERFKGRRIVLGVDRTDYIKGLPQKIKGIQRLLERNPEFKDQLVFLQICIPSRLEVKEYSKCTNKIFELVSEVNGSFGDILKTPIHLLFNSVNFNELCALYAVSDIMLITSIMDGMNLVALEYAACQDENKGVIVLSKFAGAYSTLQGSISHNPNNTEEIASALEVALSLSKEERAKRHKMNRRNIDIFTSVEWAEENLESVCPGWKDKIKKF